MYKQCKTEASSARQKQMAQGLLELMLEKNYHDITVSDICRSMNISRNSFYRYFSDKDAMLHALIDQMLLDFDLNAQVPQYDTGLSSDQAIQNILRYWISCAPLLDALAHSGLSSILTSRALLLGYSRTIDTLSIHDPESQQYANAFAIGGILILLITWHHNGFDRSIEEMAALTRRLLTESLFASDTIQ